MFVCRQVGIPARRQANRLEHRGAGMRGLMSVCPHMSVHVCACLYDLFPDALFFVCAREFGPGQASKMGRHSRILLAVATMCNRRRQTPVVSHGAGRSGRRRAETSRNRMTHLNKTRRGGGDHLRRCIYYRPRCTNSLCLRCVDNFAHDAPAMPWRLAIMSSTFLLQHG